VTPNRAIRSLPPATPFVAPETLESRLGVRFRARIGANESLFGPSPAVGRAIEKAIDRIHLYGDPQAVELRKALARMHSVDIEEIVIGPGIDGLLIHICRAFLDSERTAATTEGSYPTFEYAAEQSGCRILRVPYERGLCDLRALGDSGADLIYLANPDNPSGTYHGPDSVLQFVRSVPESSLVVLDEAYGDFVSDLPKNPLGLRNVIRLRTFSKAHGLAGLRVAYAVGDRQTLAPLHRVRGHFEVGTLPQVAARAALEDEAFLASVLTRVEDAKRDLAAILSRHGLKPLPTRTNFLLGRCESVEAAQGLLDDLLKRGVFVRKPALGAYADCVRFTVGGASEHRALDEALEGRL